MFIQEVKARLKQEHRQDVSGAREVHSRRGGCMGKDVETLGSKSTVCFLFSETHSTCQEQGKDSKESRVQTGRTPKSRLRDEISSGSCDKSLDVFSKYFTGSECSFALDAEKRKLKGIHLEGGCTVVNCSQVQLP